ncbi:MAG: hypothetical protein IKL51_07540 [Lachnospiraceae bacterium]|nr:hypothetical protein [Lachnospiraceae bacterium]
MALFDIIDDIAEKQVQKTETGDNRIPGVVIGIVVKNYDLDMPGRICVEVPTRDEKANELKWARVAMPYSGNQWGFYFLPEIGDQVLLAFEQGNIEKPYVIGCIPKDTNGFLKKSVDEKNQYKNIITKNGNKISFEDEATGKGSKDKIIIHTANQEHRLELDNALHTIRFSDKEGQNSVEMLTDKGHMTIKAQKILKIQVGTTIEVTMNGNNGTISITGTKLDLDLKDSLAVQANASVKTTAANISQDANGMMKINSNGLVNIQGNPIKIG